MKKLVALLFAAGLHMAVFAQVSLSGKVVNAATGKPLNRASIYINNSSTGTATNESGDFTLYGLSPQRYDLVISSVGYETTTKTITGDDFAKGITIKLKEKSGDLEAVVIRKYEKDGWEKYGKLFTDNLLGTGRAAEDTRIKNKEVVKFAYDKKTQVLTAYASEPLQIQNKYLGYELVYDLQEFSYDGSRRYIFFTGFPFFKEMQGSEKKMKKWAEHREYAFEGSMLQFMRAIYRNKVKEEGFTINVLQRYVNSERQRVKKIYREGIQLSAGNKIVMNTSDSSNYYHNVMQQSDSLDYVHPETIATDSIAYAADSTTAALEFKGHLQITYAKKKEMPAREQNSFHTQYVKDRPVSIISFTEVPYVLVYADGSYYDAANVLNEGFWSWSEKLSNLLPVNYKYTGK